MVYVPSVSDVEKLDRNFTYHSPKDDQPERYVQLREKARELAQLALKLCPASRELSLGMTNLEQAVMWMNSSIARNE